MKSPTYLYVKNWAELQHYTKRNPPWIKLYRRVLKDGDFLQLSEFEQWQLVRIWLASAEEHPGGWVPNDQSWLRRYTGTLKAVPIEKFVSHGWLEVCSASAHDSAVLATDVFDEASKRTKTDHDGFVKSQLGLSDESDIEVGLSNPADSSQKTRISASAHASAIASTDDITDVAKDPPMLPPRGTETHKEQPFIHSTSSLGPLAIGMNE